MNEIFSQAQALESRLIEWRRWLHSHAELSFGEHATAAYIADVLHAEGIECRLIAGTGVLARLEPDAGLEAGGSQAAPTAFVLRADIDALPICEATGLAYASENEGVMHACGHDMHAAALLGALVLLKRRGGLRHTVFGLFQPGEELLPGGATLVLAEDPFKGYDIKGFFGQHVEPELPVGTFGMRAGEYMAATDELHITVRGVGGHGALRGALKDPVKAASELIIKLLEAGNTPDSVLSIGRVEALGATNVVPDVVTLQGTLRTFGQEIRESLHDEIQYGAWRSSRSRCEDLGIRSLFDDGITVDIEIRHGYPGVVNSPELCARAAEIFGQVFGGERNESHASGVESDAEPAAGERRRATSHCSVLPLGGVSSCSHVVVPLERRMTAEDFGFYTRRYPSLFYRFGVGHPAAAPGNELPPAGGAPQAICHPLPRVGRLHTSAFNPSETALPFAAAALAALAADNT